MGAAPIELMFAALGDPIRRQLVAQLSRDGALNGSQLARAHRVSRQAIMKHLGILADVGLVTRQRHRNEVRYELNTDQLNEAAAWLNTVGAQWDQRLAALHDHLRRRGDSRSQE
jgi:DNA-binding transcriptional ArsR family regulator